MTFKKNTIATYVRLLLALLKSQETRYSAMLRMMRPRNLFQPEGTTFPNRYPFTFKQIQSLLADGPDCSLLSFGCSTGEEVASLRLLYPLALIKGIDISAGRINNCRKSHADERTQFEVGATAELEMPDFYHAVFACAVFRHADLSQGPSTCEGIISFQSFEKVVGYLVRCLRPGGYLVIRNANFRFTDTIHASGFEIIGEVEYSPDTPLYDPCHQLLPPTRFEPSIFRRKLVSPLS